ncbi:MAG: SRPBCC domain-containing protein [Sphingosinicella sp.]|nr:SRPBCC domain-containing protein [Sphingosinicella sp.]
MLPTDTNSVAFTIDEVTHTIRFARDLDASPERVFDAWTQPDQLANWWDAMGDRLAICEMDLRPGGAFRFVSRHHPDKPFTGTYLEISPPARLVFDANGATGTVLLDEESAGTRMRVEIACSSADHLAQFVAMGVADGTGKTLNNLEKYLEANG